MTKRVILGKCVDGNYALRVSKPGYDVTSNPVDNEQLIFNSDWGSAFPVYAKGVLTNLGPPALDTSSVQTFTLFSDLGYIPIMDFYVECRTIGNDGSGNYYIPYYPIGVKRLLSQYLIYYGNGINGYFRLNVTSTGIKFDYFLSTRSYPYWPLTFNLGYVAYTTKAY